MPQNKYISQGFNKGLYMDAIGTSQPDGTYNYALNAVNADFEQLGEFSNEHSNRKSIEFSSEVIGWGYIDEKDKFLVFTRDGLYLVDLKDESSKFVANDDEFSCNWNLDTCKWIIPEFKTMGSFCNETIVYWSSGCEYFKVNIDEMLDSVRKQSLKDSMKTEKNQCSDITCEYFKVFKLSCAPRISAVAYDTGGGVLPAGAYQFSVRLSNNEGGYTNWFNVSEPVYIGSEHNESGEISNGIIDIHLTNLDCNYDYGELAVIQTIGGSKIAKLVTRFNFVNGKFTYTYAGDEGDKIAISEIIAKGKTYLQGQNLIQYNGNMIYWGIRQTKNLNFQKKVIDEVKTSWVKYRIPYEVVKRNNIKSYMRGETYGFGIKYNSSDGRSTRVFHIPATTGGSDANNSSGASNSTGSPAGTIAISGGGEYKRDREPNPDTVRNPEFIQQDINTRSNVDSMTTTFTHVCSGLSDCEQCAIAATQCATDTPLIEDIYGDTGAVLAGTAGINETDLTIDYTPTNLKEAASAIMNAVENRERTESIRKDYTVDKSTPRSHQDGEYLENDSEYSGILFDINGKSEVDLPVAREDLGLTLVSEEEDLLYPDHKDCLGEYIYGGLANKNIRHHQVPWTSVLEHFISNSIGVPSVATPDADEYKDAYVDIIGVRFANIPLPTEEQLGFKLCEKNPYTICQIPRTSKNKSIHSKGIITHTVASSNDGKPYLYPTHGLNSEDSTVNRYINKNGSRLDTGATPERHYNFWSLDTMTKAHALNINQVKVEGILSGIGFRHGLYATGNEPADSKYGSRIDQKGTRQAINLNKFERNGQLVDIDYKIYAPANEVISPPIGAPAALMNKYQQESVWFGAAVDPITDRSFKGDVLDHSAPITDAQAHYVALVRDLPNQYGDLTNMVYIPILEAGANTINAIEGMCGDTFIGPHSFIRTSYVSDKVGDLFPISNMVEGKADRCVCDSPEDAVHSMVGKWVSSTFPIEGDKADPKNWAGLHTDSTSHRWFIANNEGPPISEYYYPKVVKTLITYWGEFEVNPHLRQNGNLLSEQVYNRIRPEFGLDSSIQSNSGTGWDDDYLNQFYVEVEQPSKWKIEKKALYRTLITIIAPILGLTATALSAESALEFLTGLAGTGLITALWSMMSKVLFTNDYLDDLLGIRPCKMDSEGGEQDNYIKNFFQNYTQFNKDYTIGNSIEVFYGLPVPYYTCDCDNCEEHTTDEVYISDEQRQNSLIDAYAVVRPNSYINIPASFGTLTDIFIDNTNLYAHTTDQLIPLRYGRSIVPNSVTELILGPGPIFAKPIGLGEGITEGSIGLLSRQHAINTQYGRFFLDYKAKKLYLFKGGTTELTAMGSGVYNHFRNKLQYFEDNDCPNEHINPNDIALGIDPRFERLLITKRALNPEESWTLSFGILSKQWISFHSYVPKFYVWNRGSFLSSDGKVFWNHDVRNKFQTFMGIYYPHILEFSINDRDIMKETFKGGILETLASKYIDNQGMNLLDREITYNQIWVRNHYETSGILDFYNISTLNGEQENMENRVGENRHVNLTKSRGHWSYNAVPNLIDDESQPLYVSSERTVDITPINTLPYSDSTAFRNNIHLDNYLYIRFIFNNFDEYKLYTRTHTLHNMKNPEFLL